MHPSSENPSLALLREAVIYETIASIRTRSGCIAMPLGVRRTGNRLEALLYPGSRAYREAGGIECVVIAVPSSPLDIARVLLGEAKAMELDLCCPVYTTPYLLIETRVDSVEETEGGLYRITLTPHSIKLVSIPEPFTRLASCLVELLVAYTRIRYWNSCEKRLAEYRSVYRCIEFLERRAVGDYRRYYSLVKSRIAELVEPCLEEPA